MITLTLLDRQSIVINSDLVAWITAQPDTTVRMITGETLVVREAVDEVVRRIVAFRSLVVSVVRDEAASAPSSVPRACVALRAVRERNDEHQDRAEAEWR